MILTELPQQLFRQVDNIAPFNWESMKKESWVKAEEYAYSVYKDRKARIEGYDFFHNYFLEKSEPDIFSCAITDSVANTSYYKSGRLVAFSSLFLCDFRNSSIPWHNLIVGGSIGIITRKSFSIRSPDMIDDSYNIPYIRTDNLTFIQNSITRFPRGTRFSICAHFQPESLVLLKNLIKISRLRGVSKNLRNNSKIESVLRYLPENILDTFEVQEKEDSSGTSYLVCSFVS